MAQNKRARIALGFVLALCVAAPGCGWEPYPPNQKFPNVKVQFVNNRSGWIIGPALLRTQDGGSSWQKLRQDGPGTIVSEVAIFDHNRFQFVDERVGFALGRKRGIYKTTDGGETWTEFALPPNGDPYRRFQTVFFLSATKGWLAGPEIYRTDNGCITWTKLGPAPPDDYGRAGKPSIGDPYDPAVWFFNEQNGVLARLDGDIYKTEDGGVTWRRVWSTNKFTLHLHFANDKDGWLVGDEGFVARTKDGGLSWQEVIVPTRAQLHRIFFLNEKKGWAVGMHGAIIYTIDGGDNWLVANNSGTNSPLTSVHFIDEQRGWAVGGDLFDDLNFSSVPSNLILETRDGGLNWVRQN